MKLKEYQRLRRDIEDECRKKLEALEIVWKFAQEGESSNGNHSDTGSKKGALKNAVQAAIVAMPQAGFTVNDIEEWIAKNRPDCATKRASVSSALKRLVGEEITSYQHILCGAE